MNLISVVGCIFRKKYERNYDYPNFKPYFYRVIGVNDANEYNNELRTLKDKCEEFKDECLIFDGSIPLSGEMELIGYIYNELNNMDILNMKVQDITIFENAETNRKFLEALDYVIPKAIEKEKFFNDSVRNNFITKLIVWTFSYVKGINFSGDQIPKCIFYGNIDKHEIYFLILLYKMNFDVIYLNPLKEEMIGEIATESEVIKELGILQIESFEERCRKGKTIELNETLTKQLQREVDAQLFQDTGMYKPWQFRDGYTKSFTLDTILEDIYVYWNEDAKLRPGFAVTNNVVKVPTMFFKIDGRYEDIFEYQKLVKACIGSENTLIINNREIVKDISSNNELYSVTFCQLSNGEFDIEALKEVSFYKYGKYEKAVQDFILRKFNELIGESDVLNNKLSKEDVIKCLGLILNLDEKIIRMIDNFDYTKQVPKIVVFIDKEDNLSVSLQVVLAYLHVVGMDIVIFNPSGLFNMNYLIKPNVINTERLDNMEYNLEFFNLMNMRPKKNMFSKFLGL